MRFVSREAWGYAVLLIVLCATASLAVWRIIEFLADRVPSGEFHTIAAVLWSLTLGFMLIAGAFGLWATQFAAEAEGRRRVSRMVEAMDYLRDGLLAVDARGRIMGANPAARAMFSVPAEVRESLHRICAGLSEEDGQALSRRGEPVEIERTTTSNGTQRTLRFRSQHSEGLSLVLVSDVTAACAQRLRSRQMAQMHLIGQISRGVAHDFHSLLWNISGHATVVRRLAGGGPQLGDAARAIVNAAERGITMASQLLKLAGATPEPAASLAPTAHVRNAAEALRGALSDGWRVEVDTEGLPPVSMTGAQIEQVILNVGLLVANEVAASDAVLRIVARRPRAGTPFELPPQFAVAVLISASALPDPLPAEGPTAEAAVESGTILSVVRSIVEQTGGRLDVWSGPDRTPIFRIALPHGLPARSGQPPAAVLPEELRACISRWRLLVASADEHADALMARVRELGAQCERADNIVAALARIEAADQLDGIVINHELLHQEANALLRAIMKLRPAAGVVVLCEVQPAETARPRDVMFLPFDADPNRILLSLVEARSLAMSHGRK